MGLDPTCSLYVSAEQSIPVRLDSTGKASFGVLLAVPAGTRYTQAAILDPALTTPLPLLTTNGLETRVGGIMR